MKKSSPRAPRNRTLTLSDEQQRSYAGTLLRPEQVLMLADLQNRIICGDMNECIKYLPDGFVDLLIIIDNEPAKAFVNANAGLKVLDTSYADEDYAACFAQENDALREAVDAAIEELILDGTIDGIIAKYIPAN